MYFELRILNCWNNIVFKVPSQPSHAVIVFFARRSNAQSLAALGCRSIERSEHSPNINPIRGKPDPAEAGSKNSLCLQRSGNSSPAGGIADHRPPHQPAPLTHLCPFPQCSVSCGRGVQRRAVQCHGGAPTAACDPASQPAAQRDCQLPECPTHRWAAGEWQAVSGTPPAGPRSGS